MHHLSCRMGIIFALTYLHFANQIYPLERLLCVFEMEFVSETFDSILIKSERSNRREDTVAADGLQM